MNGGVYLFGHLRPGKSGRRKQIHPLLGDSRLYLQSPSEGIEVGRLAGERGRGGAHGREAARVALGRVGVHGLHVGVCRLVVGAVHREGAADALHDAAALALELRVAGLGGRLQLIHLVLQVEARRVATGVAAPAAAPGPAEGKQASSATSGAASVPASCTPAGVEDELQASPGRSEGRGARA